jgi:SAM-dependent methyltransferase
MISESVRRVWGQWIEVAHARCHLHFQIEKGDLNEHVRIGREVGRRCAKRVAGDLLGEPAKILEVGSSVGFNCLGLAEHFPHTLITGIEPDGEACTVASSMAVEFGLGNARFIRGAGECLPFPDETFDWVICHTVIEHVRDVDVCIAEMARVLRSGGKLHLEAPNYLWPWEPHLRIVMPPLSPKSLLRLFARMQGASCHIDYADHLKLVHPAWLERCFRVNGLRWFNRNEEKLRFAADGKTEGIVAYGRAARFLGLLKAVNMANPLIRLLMLLRVYPSLLYTAYKPLTFERLA